VDILGGIIQKLIGTYDVFQLHREFLVVDDEHYLFFPGPILLKLLLNALRRPLQTPDLLDFLIGQFRVEPLSLHSEQLLYFYQPPGFGSDHRFQHFDHGALVTQYSDLRNKTVTKGRFGKPTT
jgi:hypothetical protein